MLKHSKSKLDTPPFNKKRVLFATDSLGRGGAERQLSLLARSMPAEWVPFVWSLEDGEFAKELASSGIEVKINRRHFDKDLSAILDLFATANRIKPKTIHSWGWMSSIAASVVSLILGIQHVGTIRSASIPPRRAYMVRLAAHLGFRIIANSQAGLDVYRIRSRGRVVYNGFDLRRLQCSIANDENNGAFTRVIMAGRISYSEKNFEAFLQAAWTIVDQDASSWRFSVFGDGPDIETLKMSVGDLLVGGNIIIRTDINDIVPHLHGALAGVLVSPRGEGCSNTIMEYMACALPVVCSNAGGNREIVQHGKTGFLLSSDAPGEIVARLLELKQNPALAKSMGESGQRRIFEKYSVKKMVEQTVSIYNEGKSKA